LKNNDIKRNGKVLYRCLEARKPLLDVTPTGLTQGIQEALDNSSATAGMVNRG